MNKCHVHFFLNVMMEGLRGERVREEKEPTSLSGFMWRLCFVTCTLPPPFHLHVQCGMCRETKRQKEANRRSEEQLEYVLPPARCSMHGLDASFPCEGKDDNHKIAGAPLRLTTLVLTASGGS
jgi:hypothetical protein